MYSKRDIFYYAIYHGIQIIQYNQTGTVENKEKDRRPHAKKINENVSIYTHFYMNRLQGFFLNFS